MIHYTNNRNAISIDMYPNDCCLYAFDLIPDLSAQSSHWNMIRRGSLRIETTLDIAVTESVNCVVFGEFCSFVELDKYRNILRFISPKEFLNIGKEFYLEKTYFIFVC